MPEPICSTSSMSRKTRMSSRLRGIERHLKKSSSDRSGTSPPHDVTTILSVYISTLFRMRSTIWSCTVTALTIPRYPFYAHISRHSACHRCSIRAINLLSRAIFTSLTRRVYQYRMCSSTSIRTNNLYLAPTGAPINFIGGNNMSCENVKKDKCPCTYSCSRHGKCCECVSSHLMGGEFPACFFSAKAEAAYDRSFKALVRDRTD